MRCEGKRMRDGNPCRNYCKVGFHLCHLHLGIITDSVKKIQRYWRNRKWIQRLRVNNREDFCTLQNIFTIPNDEWFVWKGCNNQYYGCSRSSIFDWLENSNINPYTNEIFAEEELNNIRSRLQGYKSELNESWENKDLRSLIFLFCTKLVELEYYGNPNWLLELNDMEWVDWVHELDECISSVPVQTLQQMNLLDLTSFKELWFIVGDTLEEKKRQVMSACIHLLSVKGEDERKLCALWIVQSLGKIVDGIPGTSSETASPRQENNQLWLTLSQLPALRGLLWDSIDFHLVNRRR